jgi:hypothetical protein
MTRNDLKPFEGGKWAGYQRYACPDCPYDSVEPDTFRRHLSKHAPKRQDTGLLLPGDPGFDAPANALRTNPDTNGGTQ